MTLGSVPVPPGRRSLVEEGLELMAEIDEVLMALSREGRAPDSALLNEAYASIAAIQAELDRAVLPTTDEG